MQLVSPPLLETDRLLLRPLTPELYNAVFESCSDDELKQFFGFTTDQELWLEKQKHKEGLTTYKISFILFHLLEKSSGDVIGMCGYHTWYVHHFRAEIGYGLHEESKKGKGFMKEAIAPIIAYGFNKMNLNRVEALVGTGNSPSLRLLKGMGFAQEGLLREHYYYNGHLQDSLLFSLLKTQYLKR